MTRIRVLHLISGIAIGNQVGGAELHALQMTRCFNPELVEAALFPMWRYHDPTEQKWEEVIAAAGLPLWGLIPREQGWWAMWRALVKAVHTFQPHIIHTHSERGDLFNIALHLSHPVHPLAVRTIHIDQRWRTHPQIGPWLEDSLLPQFLAHECVVSAVLKELLLAQGHSPERVTVCYNGIDAAAFQAPPHPLPHPLPEGVPDARPRLGIIGRLTTQKGHADLLSAIALVHKKTPVHLLIIGEGPERQALQQQTQQLGLASYVHFLGSRSDIWPLLATLDLFVIPSLWEGFPTVILEAMAQNVPVIASDVAGSKELVRHGQTGYCLPPQNPVQWAETIIQALDHPTETQALARQARIFASQFTIQNAAAAYTQIYQQLKKTALPDRTG